MTGPTVKCALQSLDETDDDYGTTEKTWTNRKNFHAVLSVLSAREASYLERLQMQYDHKLHVDFKTIKSVVHYLRPSSRILIAHRIYDIISIENHFKTAVVLGLRLQV